MRAYKVSYRKVEDSPVCANIVWAEDYGQVSEEFSGCDWFSAHVAPMWQIKECRAKGMPERWL